MADWHDTRARLGQTDARLGRRVLAGTIGLYALDRNAITARKHHMMLGTAARSGAMADATAGVTA